uniref:Uncharacterized protein n=1 Tax=Oryza barthii TaxID=65489 RepID=A0A0G2KBL8_9ORYZ
MLDMTGNS